MAFSEMMKALADPVRREILLLLRRGETTAGELARHFPITVAAVSYHLAQLRKADLVYERREKNFIYYALNTTMLEELMLWLDQFRLPERGTEAAGEGAEP